MGNYYEPIGIVLSPNDINKLKPRKMENFITDIINEQIQKLNDEKERLIIARIKIIIGEDIDIKKEVRKMFPRIACKFSQIDKSEAFFWNDGT
jgi:hypothetical protein